MFFFFTNPPFLFLSCFHSITTGDYILEAKPKEISEAQRLNYEQVTETAVLLVTHRIEV